MKQAIPFLMTVIALLAVGGLIAGYMVFRDTGRVGSGSLEQWIGSQLKSIANGYLNPTLEFDTLDYQAPRTVVLTNLRLTAGDSLDVIAADRATIELGRIPRVNEPIVLTRIRLEKPLLQLVAAAPGSGRFVGLSDILKSTPSSPDDSSSPPAKLSDVLEMRQIELDDGRIVYDPRIAGTVPLILDQIDSMMNISPDERGLFSIRLDLRRSMLIAADLTGKLNLDTFEASELRLDITADLSPGNRTNLPPELQKLLDRYEVAGKLVARATGSLPLTEPLDGTLAVNATLSDARVRPGEFPIPVDRIELAGTMANRLFDLTNFKLRSVTPPGQDAILDIDLTGRVGLDDLIVDNVNLDLRAALTRENRSYLPAEIASMLQTHDIVGSLRVRATGRVPAETPQDAVVHVSVNVQNAEATFDAYRIPISVMRLAAQIEERRVMLRSLDAGLLGGRLEGVGMVRLDDPQLDSDLQLKLSSISLADLMATKQADEQSNLQGYLDGVIELDAAPVLDVLAVVQAGGDASVERPILPASWGDGTLSLRDGRLVRLPVLGTIKQILGQFISLGTGANERVELEFQFAGDRVRLSKINYSSTTLAARGDGSIGLDQTLDLTLNAGPVEKLQAMLGGIGSAIGKLTDAVGSYRVTGTLDEPKVALNVAGGGAVNKVRSGIGSIGRGIGDAVKGVVGSGGDASNDEPPR